MILRLNLQQYEFLKSTLSIEKADLFKWLPNNPELSVEISDEVAIEIRDWISEKLQKEGYDKDYELNERGKLLDQLEDILYS